MKFIFLYVSRQPWQRKLNIGLETRDKIKVTVSENFAKIV